MIVCGLDESVDNGLIGYSDPKFEFYSPLNEENQQKIHDYIDRKGLSDPKIPDKNRDNCVQADGLGIPNSLRPILDEKLADPNYKIVFVLDSPSRLDFLKVKLYGSYDMSHIWTNLLFGPD